MKLVVGLGNPGEKYALTRHNLGFMVIDDIVTEYFAPPKVDKKHESIVYSLDKDRIVLKPQTYMNLSGRAVAGLVNFYKIPLKNILVIHDEIDLPFGEVRHQIDRGAAGHNGVQSIIDNLKTKEFERVRVGVGRPKDSGIKVEDWLLTKFDEPKEEVAELIEKSKQIVVNWLKS